MKHNEHISGGLCCDSPKLRAVGAVNHAVYNFIPMRLEKVMNVNMKFHCESCGSNTTASSPGTMPGAMFSNLAGALSIAECYFHNATIGSVAERFGVNKGTLIGMAHRYADALEPLYHQIIFEMRKSLFLHADETGWTMDGKKAYAWLFANDLFQVFAFRETHGSKVPKEILREEKSDLILVILRKISFGCQSERGMRTREILMTILHTAKCRGHDPVNFFEKALNILTEDPKAGLQHFIFPDKASDIKKDSTAA